jgi:Fe2+ transport system protein FeoA
MNQLSSITQGSVRITSIDGEGAEVIRLKRLGLCDGGRITIVSAGDPMILDVVGTRIGLSRKLAGRIMVDPVLPAADDDR